MAPVTQRRSVRGMPRAVAGLAAAAAIAALRLQGAFVAAPGGLRAPARPHRVVLRAGDDDAGMELKGMDAAGVYMTDVDQMTAELDVSNIPEEMGVYAVYDEDSKMQYVGLSRNVQKSIAGHADNIGVQDAPGLITSVRVLELPGGSKEALKATWEKWIKEHMNEGGEIPAGNLPDNAPGNDPRWRSRPAAAKPSLDLAGPAGIQSMAEAIDAVQKAITKHPVVLFMKGTPMMPACGFSARTVGILGSVGVPYESVNVMDDRANPGVRDAVKQVSNWPTIPQLFVNGQLIGGCDIITEMYDSGKLKPALQNAAAGGGAGEEEESSDWQGEVSLVSDAKRPTASLISKTLADAFDLRAMRIIDQSGDHEGDAGAMEMGLTGESHFTLEITAPDFAGLGAVQRQQKVFDILKEAGIMTKVHALSLVTKTPREVEVEAN